MHKESARTWAVVLVCVDAGFLCVRQRHDLLCDDIDARLFLGELEWETRTIIDTARPITGFLVQRLSPFNFTGEMCCSILIVDQPNVEACSRKRFDNMVC